MMMEKDEFKPIFLYYCGWQIGHFNNRQYVSLPQPIIDKPCRERSVARKNINLEILDMSVFDKFTRFDRKDEISLKKTVFDEIRVKVSVDLA